MNLDDFVLNNLEKNEIQHASIVKRMKKKLQITLIDYMKAIKIADREINLDNGFKSAERIFKTKKTYNRKRMQAINK
jgi:hypothetical protein